jgi:endonuclease-3 related protein
MKLVGPLQRLARWVAGRGSAEALDDISTGRLREELLGVNGIGPASADAVLLLALRRPVFPVDRASYRVLVRHGWLDTSADYEEARAAWERPAGDDPGTLARLAAGLEQVGREFCRASVARCERCPLRPLLPTGVRCSRTLRGCPGMLS